MILFLQSLDGQRKEISFLPDSMDSNYLSHPDGMVTRGWADFLDFNGNNLYDPDQEIFQL
jgi:hypothetical protein